MIGNNRVFRWFCRHSRDIYRLVVVVGYDAKCVPGRRRRCGRDRAIPPFLQLPAPFETETGGAAGHQHTAVPEVRG